MKTNKSRILSYIILFCVVFFIVGSLIHPLLDHSEYLHSESTTVCTLCILNNSLRGAIIPLLLTAYFILTFCEISQVKQQTPNRKKVPTFPLLC